MSTLLIYMIKAAIYIAGFYVVYSTFLSIDTMHGRNRAFIVFSVALAFIMPFFTINISEQESLSFFGKRLTEILVTADLTNTADKVTSGGAGKSAVTPLFKVYLAGIIITGLKLVIDILNLLFLIVRRKNRVNHIVIFTGFNTAGFSAMGYIFINRSLRGEETDEIIKHEQNHLDQNHFLDILFMEVVKVLQWFNPVIYLFNRSLRAIHEYQADERYLSSGMPVMRYQNLLLNHVFRSKIFNITNSFSNPSMIKKRMIMMTKERSDPSSSLKLLLIVPVVALFLFVISACEKSLNNNIQAELSPLPPPVNSDQHTIEISGAPVYTPGKETEPVPPPPSPPLSNSKTVMATEDAGVTSEVVTEIKTEDIPAEVFVVVEKMPRFPGGDSALMKFIYDNIQYPQPAKDNNIQGKVILRFAVMADGEVDRIQVLKGVDTWLDQEAIRVIKMLPKLEPGRQGDRPVNVWYSVPVTFQLK